MIPICCFNVFMIPSSISYVTLSSYCSFINDDSYFPLILQIKISFSPILILTHMSDTVVSDEQPAN